MLLSARNAFSELPSITSVIVTDSTIAANIPAHSEKSASPDFKNLPIFAPSAIASPNSKIISIGSLSAAKRREKNPFFFSPVILLSPYSERRSPTFLTERPRQASLDRLLTAYSALLS